MNNISVKVNLRQLKSTVRTMRDSKGQPIDCLIIPVTANHLVVGEKGIYIDFQAYPIQQRDPNNKNTHILKQSLPKDVYDNMSTEERLSQPVMGNCILWGRQEAEPQEFPVQQYNTSEAPSQQVDPSLDDLPF